MTLTERAKIFLRPSEWIPVYEGTKVRFKKGKKQNSHRVLIQDVRPAWLKKNMEEMETLAQEKGKEKIALHKISTKFPNSFSQGLLTSLFLTFFI